MPDKIKTFKEAREQYRPDQNQVAKELNTKQSIISKIENGLLYGIYYIKYLRFLRKKGIDLNEFFSEG